MVLVGLEELGGWGKVFIGSRGIKTMVSEGMYKAGIFVGKATGVLGALGAVYSEVRDAPGIYTALFLTFAACGWLNALGLKRSKELKKGLDDLLIDSPPNQRDADGPRRTL